MEVPFCRAVNPSIKTSFSSLKTQFLFIFKMKNSQLRWISKIAIFQLNQSKVVSSALKPHHSLHQLNITHLCHQTNSCNKMTKARNKVLLKVSLKNKRKNKLTTKKVKRTIKITFPTNNLSQARCKKTN